MRVVAPHFVAGVDVGKAAAPIVKYMRSWSVKQIFDYCQKKGWRAELLRKKENDG